MSSACEFSCPFRITRETRGLAFNRVSLSREAQRRLKMGAELCAASETGEDECNPLDDRTCRREKQDFCDRRWARTGPVYGSVSLHRL